MTNTFDCFELMLATYQPDPNTRDSEESDWDDVEPASDFNDPVNILIRREEAAELERKLIAAEKAATEKLKTKYSPKRKVLYLVR